MILRAAPFFTLFSQVFETFIEPYGSALSDSANRTSGFASAAVDAGISIDNVLGIALRDSVYRTCGGASSAADASVRNNTCHNCCRHRYSCICAVKQSYSILFWYNRQVIRESTSNRIIDLLCGLIYSSLYRAPSLDRYSYLAFALASFSAYIASAFAGLESLRDV